MTFNQLLLLSLLFTAGTVFADSSGHETAARYLANEGVMVVQGDTKVVFDPLFRNGYGRYQLLRQ